jgi:hypothetical protein
MNSENPARLRRDARDGLRKSLPETQDRQDQGASAELSRRLAARRQSAEGHAPLAADLQSVVGNTVVHAALAGAETGPGSVIESALTLGAAGMSVADSTAGLFQNSFMQQQVASSSPTLAAAAKTAARHAEDEEFSVDASKKLNTALKRGGRPLPADVRARMESAFGGADFSGVRIHTDGAAVAASSGIRAHAFAVGEHIFFGQGEFQPASRGGQHLLAHELTHVVQHQEGRLRPGQNSGGQAGDIAVSSPHDAHEREAERVASQVVTGFDATAELAMDAAPDMAAELTAPAPTAAPAASEVSRQVDHGPTATATNQNQVTASSNGVTASSSLEGQAGYGAKTSIQLADKEFSLGGETFRFRAGLDLEVFAGVKGKIEAKAKAQWANVPEGGGVPKVDEFLENVNSEVVNAIAQYTDTNSTEPQTSDAASSNVTSGTTAKVETDGLSRGNNHSWNRNQNTAGNQANVQQTQAQLQQHQQSQASYLQKQQQAEQLAQNSADMGGSATDRYRQIAEHNRLQAEIDQRAIDRTQQSLNDSQNALTPDGIHQSNQQIESHIDQSQGVKAEVSADVFAGVEAKAAFKGDLDWKRKKADEYDYASGFKRVLDLLKVACPPVGIALAMLERMSGPDAVDQFIDTIITEVFSQEEGWADIAEASIAFSGRAGVGASAKFKMGFVGGKLKWVASAGATWGLGGSFETQWGIDTANTAQLALVLISDEGLQAILADATAAAMQGMETAERAVEWALSKVDSFVDAFTSWISADDSIRDSVAKKEHTIWPAAQRSQALQTLLVGFFNVISDDDELAAIEILKVSRTKGDLAAVVDGAGRENMTSAGGWFSRQNRQEFEALVGSAAAPASASRAAAGPIARDTAVTPPGGAGAPLPSQLAGALRSQLGTAVDGVRVHTGPEAVAFARSLNAKAVTVGTDIFFNHGFFRPGTTEGEQLIGHEMHHAVIGGGAKGVSQPGDAHERAADAFGDQFVASGGSQALSRLGGGEASPSLQSQVSDRLSGVARPSLSAAAVAPQLAPSSPTLQSTPAPAVTAPTAAPALSTPVSTTAPSLAAPSLASPAPAAELSSPSLASAPTMDAAPAIEVAPAADLSMGSDIGPISTPMGSDSSFSRDVLSGSSPFASDTTSGTQETQAETHAELTIAGKVYRVRVPPSEGQTATANCDLDARPCEGLHLTGGTVNIDADGIVTGGTVRGVLEVPGLFNGTEVALGILPGGQIAPAVQGLPVKVGPASGTVDLSITEAGLTGSGRIQAAELGLPSWVGIQSGELEIHFQGTEVAGNGALQGTATANGVARLEASLENQVLTADVTYTLTPGLAPVPGVVINNGVLTGTITHNLAGSDQAAGGPEGGSAGPAPGGPTTDSPATAAPASPATDGPGAEGSGAPTGPDADTAAQASAALQGGGQETTTDGGSGGGPGGGESALAAGGGGQGTDFLLQGSANLTLAQWVNGDVQLAMDPAAGIFNATGTLSAANEMQFGEILAIRSEISLTIEQNVPTESNAVVEFTAPKVAGTITGTYNIQEHRLDGTANAHLTHHWPLEADWGRFRLLRHGRLDAVVENNELKDITGRVRFDATVESGESPLELEGIVEGAFDVQEEKVNGTATGNTTADFLLPSSAEGGATEQFTLLAGSTIRGTVTDNQLATVTMQAGMRYDREGAPFLEGQLSDATYDIQSSQVSGEGTFTLLTSLERSTKNGEWTLRLMEGSEITATVANNSLTELGGDITVQVDDAQGALATGELKSARIEVGTWLTSGTIELSTARKFFHPGEGQTLSSGHTLEVLPGSGISGTLSDDVLTDVGADLRTMIKDEEGSLARLRLQADYDLERNLVDGKGTLSLARQLVVAENLAGQGWTAKVKRGTKAEGHIEDNDFTKVTGELKARVDDEQGQFLDVTGQGEWTTADDLFDVSGTMTVSREKELASGGEGGWSIALLAEESAATATIEDDVFQGIEGTIATMVRRAEGDFAKVALGGSWNETQGFTGEGEAELMTDLEVATIGAYNLWVVQGAGARIAVDQNSLSEIGGTVPMRLDDSGQEFIKGGVEGTYRIQEKLLSGTGSAEVLVEKHLGTMGDDQLWLIPSTNATITVADNALTEVGGEMNLSVRNGEGEYARIALTGSFDAAGGTGFTGTGSVEVVRDNKLFEQDDYSFWLKVGSGATAHIEADELKKIDGQVPFMVKDGGPAPLIEGSVEGEYDPTTGQITGTGAVYLGRTLEYDLGGGVQLKLLEGSGGDADVQESQLQRLGGTLTAQIWKDGAGVVEVTAQGEYNVVTNTLTRLEGTARLMQPLSLLDGQIEISNLTGSATIENNELVEAGGNGQIVIHPLNDMTGSFELEWSNRGGNEQYSGRGTLEFTLIETDATTGRGMSGTVDAEVNSDGTFSASGDVDYRVNEFLGGSLQVSVDQEMDPLLSGNIEIDGDLVPGRELFKMERDIIPEQTVRLPYGLALFYGMKGGMGADLDPLTATADIAISNWRPLSEDAAVPTFETELNLTWGMGFQAMVAPYIGLGGDIGFASAQMGVRGEVSLDAHVQAEAGGMLRGDGGGFYGELSVGVACAPTMDLAIIPYIKGEIPELFSFEEDLDRFEQPLGTIFEFEWGGTYGFGDRSYKRDAPTQDLDVPAPTQRDTQVEGRPEVGIGNGGGAANNQANGPQLESGSEIAAQQQVGEGEMSEVMDTLNDVIAVVEGIGAAGELFGMLASALTALATFGPAGLVVWIVWGIFTGDLSWDRIKEAVIKVIDAVAAAGRLLRDHFPGWWNRIVDVFNGDKPGLLDALFGADDRMRDAVRAGDHLVGPYELHVEMVNTMKGGWLSSADADCIGAVFEEAARRGTLHRLVSECGGADDFIDGWSTGFNDERIKRVFRRNGIDW